MYQGHVTSRASLIGCSEYTSRSRQQQQLWQVPLNTGLYVKFAPTPCDVTRDALLPVRLCDVMTRRYSTLTDTD